jgi:hypothetical protein
MIMTTPARNNDVYNHPQSEEENDTLPGVNEEGTLKENTALNPNPRANENVSTADATPEESQTTGVGSEVTDGEDG